MRRDPQALLLAHKMDRARRTLFVEGRRDRLFVAWLASSRCPDAQVLEIDTIEVSVDTGGNRARCIALAQKIPDSMCSIRVFVDADWDRIFKKPQPPSVWLTDHRDLESYCLRVECFEKMLVLGLCCEGPTPSVALGSILTTGRALGVLRILSVREALNLPFQSVDLFRHSRSSQGLVSVNRHEYLRALVQNAGISLARLAELTDAWQRLEEELAKVPDLDLVHGKDAVALISRMLHDLGGKKDAADAILMTAYERRFLSETSTLENVVSFLEEAQATPARVPANLALNPASACALAG